MFLSKYVLKNFAKFTDKHLCRSLLFNKVAGWKPETVRGSHWRCSVNYIGVFKKAALAFQNQPFIDLLRNSCYWIIDKLYRKKPVLKSLCNKAAVPRNCNFIKEDSDTGASLWNWQTFRICKFPEQLFWTKSVNVCFETLFKKRLQHRGFPVNFVNYSRAPILYRIYEQLVLKHQCGVSF